MKHTYLEVTEINPNLFILKVGVVSVQIDKKHLEILSTKIAAILNVNLIEDDELQKLFEKYDDLNINSISTVGFNKKANGNANSTIANPV